MSAKGLDEKREKELMAAWANVVWELAPKMWQRTDTTYETGDLTSDAFLYIRSKSWFWKHPLATDEWEASTIHDNGLATLGAWEHAKRAIKDMLSTNYATESDQSQWQTGLEVDWEEERFERQGANPSLSAEGEYLLGLEPDEEEDWHIDEPGEDIQAVPREHQDGTPIRHKKEDGKWEASTLVFQPGPVTYVRSGVVKLTDEATTFRWDICPQGGTPEGIKSHKRKKNPIDWCQACLFKDLRQLGAKCESCGTLFKKRRKDGLPLCDECRAAA